MQVTEYTPDEIFLSAPVTTRAIIKAGQSFPKYTPLMPDETDAASLVKWDGTPGKALAIAAKSVASGAEQSAVIYAAGGFRISAINWPESVTTDKAKRAAFLGSAIYVDDEA
ncbi:head decoration protein [Vibrio cholerae]